MSSVLTKGDLSALVEQSNSPQWEFAEKISATQIFRGSLSLCRSSAPRKGALGTGDYAGLTVESSTVLPDKGGLATLTIRYEGAGTDTDESQLPPDEFSIDNQPQEFALEKHPRYSGLSQTTFEAIRQYPTITDVTVASELWQKSIAPYDRAIELSEKLLRGQTHFTLWVPVYNWTAYYITEPSAESGGFGEDPFGPLAVPLGWEWLRKGDLVGFNGTYYTLTRSWQAAIEIDADVYPVGP